MQIATAVAVQVGCLCGSRGVLYVQCMNADATPAALPTALDVFIRGQAADVRPVPKIAAGYYYVDTGPCRRPAGDAADEDDPPRMFRLLVATTSDGPAFRTYVDCARFATAAGEPYTVDVRLRNAESDAIIDVLNHDYELLSADRRGRTKQ